jgi:hypothetical protein
MRAMRVRRERRAGVTRTLGRVVAWSALFSRSRMRTWKWSPTGRGAVIATRVPAFWWFSISLASWSGVPVTV